MTLLDVRPTWPNGTGVQIYLRGRMVTDSGFPLDLGGDVICQTIPGKAVVLMPAGDPPAYPVDITAREPSERRIDPTVSPPDIGLHTTERGPTRE